MFLKSKVSTVRRLGALTAALAAAIAVAACGSSGGSSTQSTQAAAGGSSTAGASSGKTYIIGTSADFPPFSSPAKDDPNTIVGFEPDMMKAVMGHLGWKYEWKRSDFNGLIPALQSGRIDMVVSDLYDTAERRKVIDFVPYLLTGLSIMVTSSNAANVQSFMDLCGKPVGILTGSPSEVTPLKQASKQCAAQGKPGIDTHSYSEVAQEVPALEHGVLYAIFEDSITLGLIQDAKHGAVKVAFDDPSARTKIGIGVKKGGAVESQLRDAMQWYLSTPDYKANVQKWGFPTSSMLKPS